MSCVKCHSVEIPNSIPKLCPECFINDFEKAGKLPYAFIASISDLMDTYDEATIIGNKLLINVEGIVFSTILGQNYNEKYDRDIRREWRCDS